MNYKKMRLILIVMLICTNLIMLCSLAYTDREDEKIYENMIADNVLFLENKGIYVDGNILNQQNIDEYMLTYSTISQKNIEVIIENISSNENNLFIGENGTAKINDDGSFAINISTSHTKESIELLLDKAGFDVSNAQLSQTNGVLKYTLKFNDFLVSNCFFEVILNNNTTTIAGNFIFGQPQAVLSENDFSVFVALVELGVYYGAKGEVDDISFEYTLSNTNNTEVLPIFRVKIGENEYFYNIFSNTVYSV